MEATHREETRRSLALLTSSLPASGTLISELPPPLPTFLAEFWEDIFGREEWVGGWVGEKFSELKEVPKWLARVGLTKSSFLLHLAGWLINASGQLVSSKNVEAWARDGGYFALTVL